MENYFLFLGINGAGKSTTINMICGELKKDSGTILVCDKEVDSDDKYIKKKKLVLSFKSHY